jgi:alpha-tubulin suppressor-like RCC1 family protein
MDGTAYCWGAGESGQIGDGSRTARLTPTKVAGSVRFSKIAAGRYHTCAISTDGDLYCWGGSSFSNIPLTPAKVDSNVRLTTISSGEGLTCGLDADGVLYCRALFGTDGVAPVPSDQRFVAVSITRQTKCALTADGKVYCWGASAFKLSSTTSPTELVTPLRFKIISTAVDRLCGVTQENTAYCIGTGSVGQIGDGAVHNTSTSGFVPVSPGVSSVTQFALVAAGLFSTCGATPAGKPFCWGLSSRIGIGFGATQFSPVMVAQPQ